MNAKTFSLLGVLMLCACGGADEATTDEDQTAAQASAGLFRPGNRFSGWSTDGAAHDEYLDQVQPILGKRCVICHSCSTSPCQFKLTAYEGVRRGGSEKSDFDLRLMSAPPRRLKDASTDEEWLRLGFYPLAKGGAASPMARFIAHGKQDNREGFDVSEPYSLYNGKAEKYAYACVGRRSADVDSRLAKSGTGMPFGLTAIPEAEYQTVAQWLAKGAPGPSAEAQRQLAAARDPAAVEAWEAFFNQDTGGARPTAKSQLAIRYLYEHLSFGRLHLDDSQKGRGDFFEVVRSRTRTGAVQEIVTERPSDSPGTAPFYYRLKKHTQLITSKDHSVFRVTAQTRAHWKSLFLDSNWNVATAPSYDELNPFVVFDAIPGRIRDQFMIENSLQLVEAMVKGDVCTGSSATYAIRDRFLNLFIKPEVDPSAADPKLGESSYVHLDPTSVYPVSQARNTILNKAFQKALLATRPQGLTVKDLWRGDGADPSVDKRNAWITVLRHDNNASVHYGPMAQMPETKWVLNYVNFERLFYNLVVLYRPWGTTAHHVNTWELMSFVRAHSEDTFLLFMPEAQRPALRRQFTPGELGSTDNMMDGPGFPSGTPDLNPAHPVEDFVARVRDYLSPIYPNTTELDPKPFAGGRVAGTEPRLETATREDVEANLYQLTVPRGTQPLAEVIWVSVESKGRAPYPYTLLANRIYASNSRIIGSTLGSINRVPGQDSYSVVRGWVGALPQLFMRVPQEEIRDFVRGLTLPSMRFSVRTQYEVPRNSDRFWKFLDQAHARNLYDDPIGAGITDTSAYLWPLNLRGTEASTVTQPESPPDEFIPPTP